MTITAQIIKETGYHDMQAVVLRVGEVVPTECSPRYKILESGERKAGYDEVAVSKSVDRIR